MRVVKFHGTFVVPRFPTHYGVCVYVLIKPCPEAVVWLNSPILSHLELKPQVQMVIFMTCQQLQQKSWEVKFSLSLALPLFKHI